ncbi:MAG: choice-of-anchor tandem repeat GloVer-containing protein [Candidatus Korobacteraceae bacterium]
MQGKRVSIGLRAVLAIFASTLFVASTWAVGQEKVLHSFNNNGGGEGIRPLAGLVLDAAGNLYGTTYEGGLYVGSCGSYGCGTVFELTPTAGGGWTEQVLYYGFNNGGTGAYPGAGLIFDAAGNLYSTTSGGGYYYYPDGTVFELTPTVGGGWTEQVLHNFGNGTDGNVPYAGLIFDNAGNLYGTTAGGGTHNAGTVFKLTPTEGGWTEQVLHNFNDTDGANPEAGLIFDAAGNLYGTTWFGGTYGNGTVFELTPMAGGGWTENVLHNFGNGTDGAGAFAGLIFDAAGNLYGATYAGGTYSSGYCPAGCGTVFELTPTEGGGWTEQVLHNFGNGADGSVPYASLIFDAAGNLYGTTWAGGTYSSGYCPAGCGTVFELSPRQGGGWTENVYSFNGMDGAGPQAGLILDAAGNLYGTTYAGGTYGWGTVFELQTVATYNTLTVSTVGNGTVTSTDGFISCPGTCSHSYLSNTQVTLNATPAAGWTFSGWSGACSGTGPCVVTMTQDLSVSATFTQLDYTLTVSTSGSGTVISTDGFISCPGTCSHSYLSNTQVTLNATPAAGWTFSGWSGACSGTGACVVTMTQALSVGATFTVGYTLTVSTSGNGTVTSTDGFIICPGTCSHTYPEGTPVTLNANAGQGWVFGGWNGACEGTSSCSVTMTQPLSVDAIFSQAQQFVAVTPCRLVDTRQTGGAIQGGSSRDFPVQQEGGCNIPATAAAYSLNVTVVPHGSLGYLTIWPTGEGRPVVSTLNSADGRVKANAAIVPAGTSGDVSVFVTDTTNVILDIDGYFAPVSGSTLAFYPLTPCRVADTRYSTYPQGLGPPSLTGGEPRAFPILSATSCNIPPTGVAAYSLNFTVVPHGSLGYLTVWPTGETQPTVSTLNDLLGRVIANAAIVVAGGGGEISAYATNNTDLVIDIDGYFAPEGAGGLSLYAVAPCRVIDTRHVGSGQPFTGTLTPPVDVEHSQCGPPATAQAYVFNATVIPPGSLGYLTLWPDGPNRPTVSTLNAADGSITNNMAIVPSTNGKVDAYASGLTQLILDISSYFAP